MHKMIAYNKNVLLLFVLSKHSFYESNENLMVHEQLEQ